jgi:hypothetical protein
MLTIPLECGYTYRPVISGDWQDFDDVFQSHLDGAYQNGDPLSANYTLKQILRMQEYGYVYNTDPSDLVYMVGLENFRNGAYRIESRLYVHPNYRRRYWKSPDNYETIKHQISNHIDSCQLLFKSREAENPAGFLISARLDPYFSDWTVFPTKIELRYRNNWQYIMYKNLKGNVDDNISKLWYDETLA